jgi:hypothetical protein
MRGKQFPKIYEVEMNPYAMLASHVGTQEAASLGTRLTAWHDAMVAHERRLRATPKLDVCNDECPHSEARGLWGEAVAIFGASAMRLSFLRSHGMPHSPFGVTSNGVSDVSVEF